MYQKDSVYVESQCLIDLYSLDTDYIFAGIQDQLIIYDSINPSKFIPIRDFRSWCTNDIYTFNVQIPTQDFIFLVDGTHREDIPFSSYITQGQALDQNKCLDSTWTFFAVSSVNQIPLNPTNKLQYFQQKFTIEDPNVTIFKEKSYYPPVSGDDLKDVKFQISVQASADNYQTHQLTNFGVQFLFCGEYLPYESNIIHQTNKIDISNTISFNFTFSGQNDECLKHLETSLYDKNCQNLLQIIKVSNRTDQFKELKFIIDNNHLKFDIDEQAINNFQDYNDPETTPLQFCTKSKVQASTSNVLEMQYLHKITIHCQMFLVRQLPDANFELQKGTSKIIDIPIGTIGQSSKCLNSLQVVNVTDVETGFVRFENVTSHPITLTISEIHVDLTIEFNQSYVYAEACQSPKNTSSCTTPFILIILSNIKAIVSSEPYIHDLNTAPHFNKDLKEITVISNLTQVQIYKYPEIIDGEGHAASIVKTNLGELSLYAQFVNFTQLQEFTKSQMVVYLNNATLFDSFQPQYYLVFEKKLPSIQNFEISFDLRDLSGKDFKTKETHYQQKVNFADKISVKLDNKYENLLEEKNKSMSLITTTTLLAGNSNQYPEFLISNISDQGLIKVVFAELMELRSHTLVKSNKLKIELIKHQNELTQDQELNLIEIKDWNCTELSPKQMTFQLLFTDFANVSFNDDDQIRITVLDGNFFKLKDSNMKTKSLFYNTGIEYSGPFVQVGFSTKSKVGNQLENNDFYKDVLRVFIVFVSYMTFSSFVVNYLLNYSLQMFWSFLNVLQMIVIIPIIRGSSFPRNLVVMYSVILPIVQFEVLPPELTTDKVFTFSNSQNLDEENFKEFYLMGYESHNSIPSLGTLYWVYMAIVFKWIIFGILFGLSKVLYINGRRKIIRYGTDQLINTSLLLSVENSLEITIALYLNVISQSYETLGDRISMYTILSLSYFLMVYVPFIIFYHVMHRKTWTPRTERVIGSMFTFARSNYFARAFRLIFISRRFIYVLIIALLRDYLIFQYQALIQLNLIVATYQARFKPHIVRSLNVIELINEWTILIFYQNLFNFTDIVPVPMTQYNVGSAYIYLMAINMCINTAYIVYRTLSNSFRAQRIKRKQKSLENLIKFNDEQKLAFAQHIEFGEQKLRMIYKLDKKFQKNLRQGIRELNRQKKKDNEKRNQEQQKALKKNKEKQMSKDFTEYLDKKKSQKISEVNIFQADMKNPATYRNKNPISPRFGKQVLQERFQVNNIGI